ncbi:MAG TPA: response regulator transcription factor [Solirubrobacteraceae bacterium]|nr:response regulator transcription factor [Solirubrobacteraceae bacterium]
MTETPTVLVIEDEEELRGALELVLARGRLESVLRADGRSGLKALYEVRPDAVVLDIGLPDIDGWEVLERIRDVSDVPVLLLTARNLEFDKVRGLQAGADDYLTKPYGNAELVARVHALIRRGQVHVAAPDEDVVDDEASGVRLELRSRRVSVNGAEVVLTPLEWRLLTAFVQHKGQVLSPEQLLELAWHDPMGVTAERVKFAVLRLRRKLGPVGRQIESVRGFGYRF